MNAQDLIPVLHKANQDARGHLFDKDAFEIKIFDQYLEKQMADSTVGLTPEDKKTVKLLKQITKALDDIVDKEKVPQKTIDLVAFKLRKLKLMMDVEYRKTLTVKQRLLLDQIHQSILTHGLATYLKNAGVEVIPYWDWSGVFRSMGTIWRQIISRWAFIELLVFPKFRGTTMSYGRALYMAWYGIDKDMVRTTKTDLRNPIYNKSTLYWHRIYVAGIISLIAFLGYDQYDQTQQAKAIQIAANAAAEQEVLDIVNRQKQRWINKKQQDMIAGYIRKNGVEPVLEIKIEMRQAAEMLYDQEMKKIESEASSASTLN